jgi:ATP-dependent DNA ligase
VARRWFDDMTVAGIEGLVIKGAAQPYRGGRRDWLKVKRRDTLDVICAAVIGPLEQPRAIVAGLPVDGDLRIVGRSTVLRATVARALSRHLQPPTGTHPWPAQVPPSAVDRFSRDREPVDLTLVEPVVVEVRADVAWSGRSFRHALRLVRVRPELDVGDVEEPTDKQ